MIEKSRPNHQQYLSALEALGPEGRLKKVFELSDFSNQLFLQGLRTRFPKKSKQEIKDIYVNLLLQKSEQEKEIWLKIKSFRFNTSL